MNRSYPMWGGLQPARDFSPASRSGLKARCRLSRNPLLKLRRLYELQAELSGLFCEHLDLLLAMFVFIKRLPLVNVVLTELQHAVEDASQFVGHGLDGLGSAEFAPQPPVLC